MKFDWKKTFVLGFGFLGISVIWPLFNSLIPPFLEDLGLSAFVVGFILTWDNLINMFVQPWVGARSDRTRSRWGRRKPWLMAGAPLAAVFFMLAAGDTMTSRSIRSCLPLLLLLLLLLSACQARTPGQDRRESR